ncbi:MAG: porin, partial [Pseudomonadota bacterium]
MKVRLLPLAISAAIAMPGVALAEGPTVYGKLNVSYEMVDVDYAYDDIEPNSADNWQLISNSSRFGVKGDAAINDSLKAIYQIEWGLDASDDNSADLTQRDRFVGLAGGFGTFQAGKFDSPLKKAQGKVDQFNDLAGDIQYVLVGENRLANILQYSTPDMSGFQGNIAFAPGEQYDDGDEEVRDGPADS